MEATALLRLYLAVFLQCSLLSSHPGRSVSHGMEKVAAVGVSMTLSKSEFIDALYLSSAIALRCFDKPKQAGPHSVATSEKNRYADTSSKR